MRSTLTCPCCWFSFIVANPLNIKCPSCGAILTRDVGEDGRWVVSPSNVVTEKSKQ